MKTTTLCSVILSLLATTSHIEARIIKPWSYAELCAKADIVVIARVLSNTNTEEDYHGLRDAYIAVNSEFAVEEVIKGESKEKKLIVLHFKVAPHKSFDDGMLVVAFRLKDIKASIEYSGTNGISFGGSSGPLPPPEYLLFLKKRSDGRYEPVTGQWDARLSVKELSDPFPFSPNDQ